MASGIWALRPLVSLRRKGKECWIREGDGVREGGGVFLAAWGDPESGGEALDAALRACWTGLSAPEILAGTHLAEAWGEGWIEGGDMARRPDIGEVWLHALTVPVEGGTEADLRAFSAEAEAALPRLAEALKRFGLDSVEISVPAGRAIAPRRLAERVVACVAETRARREAESIEAACGAGVARAARGL